MAHPVQLEAFVLGLVLGTFGIAEVIGQELVWPERRCATLTWPDGRETKIRSFDENVRFVEACEKAPGKCKLDNMPFPSKDAKGRSPGQVLADATTDCLLGPLPVEKKKQ